MKVIIDIDDKYSDFISITVGGTFAVENQTHTFVSSDVETLRDKAVDGCVGFIVTESGKILSTRQKREE